MTVYYYYYCYVLTDEILQRYLPPGGKLPMAGPQGVFALMAEADIVYHSQGRHVVTADGPRWSIALAYSGMGDGLPSAPPPEKIYRRLKELLGTDEPPMWRRED